MIIGPDLVVAGERIQTVPKARDRYDKAMWGFGVDFDADKESALEKADSIIKNTYRTLMTRGMKGCYVYATDPALRDHLRRRTRNERATKLE